MPPRNRAQRKAKAQRRRRDRQKQHRKQWLQKERDKYRAEKLDLWVQYAEREARDAQQILPPEVRQSPGRMQYHLNLTQIRKAVRETDMYGQILRLDEKIAHPPRREWPPPKPCCENCLFVQPQQKHWGSSSLSRADGGERKETPMRSHWKTEGRQP
jgi:hypothetical protein